MGWKWSASNPQLLYPRRKIPRRRLHRRLDGLHRWSGHFAAEKNLLTAGIRNPIVQPVACLLCRLRYHEGIINWHLSQETTQPKGTSQIAMSAYILATLVGRLESNFESSYLRAQLSQSRVWQRFGLDETCSRDVADFKMAASKGIDCMLVLDIRFKFSVC